MKPAVLIITVAVLLSSPIHADTVIEFKNQDTKSQFLTDGKMARINTRGTDDYFLVNFGENTIYSVTAETKQVNNISASVPSLSGLQPPSISLKLKPLGKGPDIAGYPTTRYRLAANGEYCGSIYASREALKGTAVESMFDAIKTMSDNHRQSLGGFAALIPVCQMAQIELANKLKEIGAPMRMQDKDGQIDSEITRILKNATVEEHYYAFPEKSDRASMGEKIAQKQNPPADNNYRKRAETTLMRYYQEMTRQWR
jgi:hypothetical protein